MKTCCKRNDAIVKTVEPVIGQRFAWVARIFAAIEPLDACPTSGPMNERVYPGGQGPLTAIVPVMNDQHRRQFFRRAQNPRSLYTPPGFIGKEAGRQHEGARSSPVRNSPGGAQRSA